MKKALLFSAAVLAANTALAGTVTSAVSAVASSEFGPGFGINNAISQLGLYTGYVSGVTDFDSYLASNPIHNMVAGNEWFSASGTQSASVTFDLGTAFGISSMAIWAEDAWGPMSGINFLGSTDGITFWNILSNISLVDNVINIDYGATRYDFSTVNARYIRMDIGNCGGSGCSLGEIAFNTGDAQVPEPSSLALLGLGLGLASLRLRKSKHAR